MADEDTNTAKDSEESKEPEESKVEEVKTEEQAAAETSPEEASASNAAEEKAEEPKKEAASSKSSGEPKKKVSASLEKIIEQIEKLSVIELSDLVHALEDRFGVTAAAPMMASTSAGSAPSAGEPMEEQTTFNVILTSAGANKISAIKAVRELVQTLGLKEAKDLVEAAPKPVLEGVNKQTAEEAKAKLTAAGATVELQ